MASVTRTVEARKYDHLYDRTYTVSGAKDFYKTANVAMFSGVTRVPDNANMFSDMQHYPRHQFKLDDKQVVPGHVDKQYHDNPSQPPANLAAEVTGHNRYKYFKRPIVPFMHELPPQVMMDAGDMGAPAGGEMMPEQAGEPVGRDGKRSVAVQTMYRESEAQTDPYTPDFVVKPGDNPAVLTLESLSYGRGLPAGLAEVEMIERMRQKQEFEASLPPITDEASFELRRKMMEEQELLEWSERENEIDRVQAERLETLRSALEARDRENEFVQDQRVEEMRRKKMEEKDKAVATIQRRRILALRKLGKTRQHAESLDSTAIGADARKSTVKRDIISEYADYGSKVYAPVTRKGQHPDRSAARGVQVTEEALTNLDTLQQLEATLPRSATQSMTRRPSPRAARSTQARMDRTVTQQLERVDKMLRTGELQKPGEAKEELPAWRRRQARVVRPPTPNVDAGADDEDELDNAILLLQKLLRGRAVQNMMFEGKERRLELIRELREDEVLADNKEEDKQQDDAEEAAALVAAAQDATVEALQGEVMSNTLDFMAKELVRVRQAQRLHASSQEAFRIRRTREAEEGGRRQAEQALRARQDVVYRQLQRVHTQTADSYFDDMMARVVDQAATQQATNEVYLKKSVIAPAVGDVEQEVNSGETVVRDLVASFLLPEVERKQAQEKVGNEEKRFVEAAKTSIEGVIKKVDTLNQ